MPTAPGDGPPTRAAPLRDDDAPIVMDRYRLRRRLGTGAFGTVYAARDERLERDVAVKILPRDQIVGGRFEREARAAARLQHPGIVTLYEAAVDDDGAYLVSELVRGTTFDRLLESGRMSDRDVLQVGIGLADALAHAHALGVIHRDVKPSNVLVPGRRDQNGPGAKLTDFGVARVLGGDTLTRAGDVIGTAGYMSPEQAAGLEAGPAADLYSLALVLYEALTGANPVRDAGGAGRARRPGMHVPPLRRQRRDLPRELGAAIDRALRPRPTERGQLGELRAALAAALPGAREVTGIVAPSGILAPAGIVAPAGIAGERKRSRSAAEPKAGGTYETRKGGSRRLPERGLGAASAALAAGWLSAHLLSHAPLAPVAVGLLAGAATLLAPRLGWLSTVAVLAGFAATGGRLGGALVLVALATATAVVLTGAGRLAAIPAAAAALGLLGLGTAWPAVAATTGTSGLRRAGLAAAGLAWATAAGALTGTRVPWRPPGMPAPHAWTTSLHIALHDVLIAAANGPLLPAALVWGISAAVVPLAARAPAAVAVALVAIWSGATVVATQAAGARPLHDAALGALAGGLLVAAPPLAALGRSLQDRHRVVSPVP